MKSATSTPTSALAALSALVATPSHSRLTLSIASFVADASNSSSSLSQTRRSHHNPSPFFSLSCHHPLASFLLPRKKAAASSLVLRACVGLSIQREPRGRDQGRVVQPHKWQKKDIIILPHYIVMGAKGESNKFIVIISNVIKTKEIENYYILTFLSHCSKSSFFVQKFNLDFPRTLSPLFWG